MFGPDLGGNASYQGLINPQSFYNMNATQTLPGMNPYASLNGYGIGQNTNINANNSIFGPDGVLSPTNMQGITQGLGAFTSLAQIYGMFQNLGLQKRAFKFAREGTKRNFNAQATAYNESVASKETARQASAAARGQDYNSLYAYGTGQKVDNWT
jgi:hypothetical protein